MGPRDSYSLLLQVMAQHRTGNKPLPEPMMTKFIDAMWYYMATMTYSKCHFASFEHLLDLYVYSSV